MGWGEKFGSIKVKKIPEYKKPVPELTADEVSEMEKRLRESDKYSDPELKPDIPSVRAEQPSDKSEGPGAFSAITTAESEQP